MAKPEGEALSGSAKLIRAMEKPRRDFSGRGWCRWLVGGLFERKRPAEYASCGGRRPAALSGRRGGSRRYIEHVAAKRPGKADSMSFSHMAQVRDIRGLSPSERALLYVLADFAASEGVEFGEAWPSQATLAEVLEVSERYVRGLLASLEAKGLITRRPGDRRGLRASSDRISVLPGRVARRSAASGPRRSIAPRRPGAARVSCGTIVPVATGTIVPPNLSRESIPLGPPPSSPRLPLESGGAVKAALWPSALFALYRTEAKPGEDRQAWLDRRYGGVIPSDHAGLAVKGLH